MSYRDEQSGKMYQDTNELLAVKYPHVAHLVPELNKRCGMAVENNDGHGTVSFHMKGLDACHRVIVDAIDILIRSFIRKDKDKPKPPHKQAC